MKRRRGSSEVNKIETTDNNDQKKRRRIGTDYKHQRQKMNSQPREERGKSQVTKQGIEEVDGKKGRKAKEARNYARNSE